MRACIGLLAVLLFAGCITTFQTAEVLPKGKSVVGVGYSAPWAGEIYARRGFGKNIELGTKVGLWAWAPVLFQEVKYQFAPQPTPGALILGGGFVFEASSPYVLLYPTLLVQWKGLYVGGRFILRDDTPHYNEFDVLSGGVVGVAWRPFKGRMTLFNEVNAADIVDGTTWSVGLQWDL